MTRDGRALLTYAQPFGISGVLFDAATGVWGRINTWSGGYESLANSPALVHDTATDQSGNFVLTYSLPLTTATTISVSGVPSGTYYVLVQAQNAGGTGAPSNEVAFTVAGLSAPGPPTSNTPTVSGSTVTLSWTPGSGGAPTGYTLLASATPAGVPIATVPLSGTSASFSGVPSGAYFLRLIASNGAGVSSPSAEVTLAVP